MKLTLLKKSMAAMVGCFALCASHAGAVTINASNITNSAIQFNGNSTFGFVNDGTGHSFSTTTFGDGAVGDANGLFGSIAGTFTIGAIQFGVYAPVTGPGTITIDDGGTPFSANIVWNDIQQNGAQGGLNVFAAFNLTGITYAGTKSDLLFLRNAPGVAGTLAYSFSQPLPSLEDLTNSTHSTGFSLTLHADSPRVPEGGSTFIMLGAGVLGIGLLRKKLR